MTDSYRDRLETASSSSVEYCTPAVSHNTSDTENDMEVFLSLTHNEALESIKKSS